LKFWIRELFPIIYANMAVSLRAAVATWIIGFFLVIHGALAKGDFRLASSPSYRNVKRCPERCSVAGPNPGNWSVYPSLREIRKCTQTMFYDFSIYDEVDDQESNHRVHACSSYGSDFSGLGVSMAKVASAEPVDVEFEIGWWKTGFGLATPGLRSLIRQMRQYAGSGYGATDRPFVMFGQSGQATVGLYIGEGLLNQGVGASAMKMLQDRLGNLNVSTPSLSMQLCGPGYDSTHIFGIMATSSGSFAPIQEAIKGWAKAKCLSFSGSIKVPGKVMFTTPHVYTDSTTAIATTGNARSKAVEKQVKSIHARAECRTVQVDSGDSCGVLATKCGISPADFTKYNPGSKFCANLRPKQHVCCSKGDLPDLRPKQQEDGSCHVYQVKDNDNCADLAVGFGLTTKEIEGFNKNTWGWNGCKLLFVETKICLSKGTPPFPAPIANAMCGPQKPGSTPPKDGSDISDLNPCPLTACCNIWGQCGITKDFCVDTNTGAPGTAKAGTNGCISNCGTDIVKGDGNGRIRIGYFQSYGLNRKCLFQDVAQIDTSKYTHIHFGFGTLTKDYRIHLGNELSTYQFKEFKRIEKSKKILSFGGWDFSTSPATYSIFREGVKAANRRKMATNIANFIKSNHLDGVDIDWEYPGAPDLPSIPRGDKQEGPDYLAFLEILKELLPGKSVSIAAPSSYWYLKQFPIKEISKVVDYIVYMTYDLHGQWDAGNPWSQEGCATGSCLRSPVNLTETKQALAMITKAGVPAKKLIVGITSYGRSFKMADPGCWGPNCLFTGDSLSSQATKGKCTDTAGYIADAEIEEIMDDPKRVVKSFLDKSSDTDVLIYDKHQWVGYMSSRTKKARTELYSSWGMGGTTDWATDLQKYHDVPKPAKSWAIFKQLAISGKDPKSDHTRHGSWTTFDCTHPLVDDWPDYKPRKRWNGLDADSAWEDAVRIWKDTDSRRKRFSFTSSLSATFNIAAEAQCEHMLGDNCIQSSECGPGLNGGDSGPAAQLIWNSLLRIHQLYKDYHTSLFQAASVLGPMLNHMENTFAPVPPEEDNTWALLLINLVTLGTLSGAGPFFNSYLSTRPYFLNKETTLNNIKDTSMTLVGQGTSIAKDLLKEGKAHWTPASQDAFSYYMGEAINGWANVTSFSLDKIFDGSPESIDAIWDVISNGKLIEGNCTEDMPSNILKSFFAFSIPALWTASGTHAFVLDSGYGCDEKPPLGEYLDDETMEATGYCYRDKMYYLVHPDGKSRKCECDRGNGGHCEERCEDSKFSMPPGLDSLKDEAFGDVQLKHLIEGSLRTYLNNGGKGGAGFADPDDTLTISELLDVDITTPGFIRLPVCSPGRAHQNWELVKADSSPNYPCDIPPGNNFCDDSSFENRGSDASPSVDDCRTIIANIQDDPYTQWKHTVVGKRHRQITEAGSCAFGIKATKVNGNVDFEIGGQDVIDIINDSINKFGGTGKIGARGSMTCNGNIKGQAVEWGIYHT
jgi:GH18 family chitinase